MTAPATDPATAPATAPASTPAADRLRGAYDVTRLARQVNLLSLLPPGSTGRQGRESFAACPKCEGVGTVTVRPSFFTCHRCGADGDAIRWIQLTGGLTHREAVERVIEVLRGGEAMADAKRRTDLAGLASAAFASWAQAQFRASEVAQSYWTARGFSLELAERIGVGFAPRERQMESVGETIRFGSQAMIDAGIWDYVHRPGAASCRPVFADRLLFPVYGPEPHFPVAFGGRRLNDEPGTAGFDPRKYLNSANSLLWSKSDTLWWLSNATEAIQRERTVIVVEGYFAAIRLLSLGIDNVVASCGTSLTPAHAKLLNETLGGHGNKKRLAIVLYDDGAREQAYRAARLLLAEGMDVRLPRIPAGCDDPDTWVREHGPEPLRALLATGLSTVAEARLADAVERGGSPLPLLDTVEVAEAIFEDLEVTKSGAVQRDAARLMESALGIPMDEIKSCVQQMRGSSRDTKYRR